MANEVVYYANVSQLVSAAFSAYLNLAINNSQRSTVGVI